MSDDNFGPWIDWAGGECPVADGISWQVRFRNGKEVEKPSAASNYRWDHEPDELPHGDYDIIAYRVHLPADDLLRQAIEALRNLNELNENYAPFGGEIFQDRVERAWGSARAVLTAYDKRARDGYMRRPRPRL